MNPPSARKKEALVKVGGFIQPPNTLAVDYSTYLELALIGKFKFVYEVLGIWVRHGGNFSDAALLNDNNNNLANRFSDVSNKYSIPFCKKHGIQIDWEALQKQRGSDVFHACAYWNSSFWFDQGERVIEFAQQKMEEKC